MLTDIFMPEVDVFDQPIVGITAAKVGDETEPLLAAGADIVIPKPVKRDKLEAAWIEVQEAHHRRA